MAEPSESSPSSTSGGSDFTPGTDFTTRFRNFYRMATGTMSPEGAKTYWKDADLRYEKADCKRCEDHRDWLLQYSPIIRFMQENILRLGGDLGKHNIRCRRCDEDMMAGFDQQYGIKLCANRLDTKNQVEDSLAHEMVHAYDTLRFKLDWERKDLRHAACTEIRASNLSGECRWANEFFRNKILAFTNHHQDCVRRRAVISVKNRPECENDLHAVKAVNEVWDSCFRDTRPFDEIFR